MKALILASGVGKRLRPLTNSMPKVLIKVGNKTILDYQMDNLIGCGIKEIIITTGPFEDKIKKHIREKYLEINVFYVNNPEYNTTNYIYSMWLTRRLIDDIILLHGDLLFDRRLLERLIEEKYDNCVLVSKEIRPPEKDFKAIIENNMVVKIGVEFSGKNVFFSVSLYKFSRSDFLYWLNEIRKFIEKGDTKSYAETVFNEISDRIILRPLYFDDALCMEIDTEEDFKKAINRVKKINNNLITDTERIT